MKSKKEAGSIAAKDSLTQVIYNDLLRKFMANELVPGTIIDRKSLAEEYQVSMAPLRDALQRLALEGFIETRSRSATVVKAVQRDDVYGTLVMREALESQAARMICGETVQENLAALLEHADHVDTAVAMTDYWQADVEFHCQLVALSKCELLIETHKKIMNVGRFYQLNNYFMNRDPQKRESHHKLVEALLTRDPDEAERIMRHHVMAGKSDFQST